MEQQKRKPKEQLCQVTPLLALGTDENTLNRPGYNLPTGPFPLLSSIYITHPMMS